AGALMGPRRAKLTAKKRSAEEPLASARRALARTRVRAPIAGFIQRLNVDYGERVQPGEPVARIVDVSRMEVPVRVALSASAFVRVGDRAIVRSDGPPGGSWSGRVTRTGPAGGEARGSLTVFVEVVQESPRDQPPGLVPGAFVRATVYTGRGGEAVVVPRSAVNDQRVMLVNDTGKAESRAVRVAYYSEGRYPEIHPVES